MKQRFALFEQPSGKLRAAPLRPNDTLPDDAIMEAEFDTASHRDMEEIKELCGNDPTLRLSALPLPDGVVPLAVFRR